MHALKNSRHQFKLTRVLTSDLGRVFLHHRIENLICCVDQKVDDINAIAINQQLNTENSDYHAIKPISFDLRDQ